MIVLEDGSELFRGRACTLIGQSDDGASPNPIMVRLLGRAKYSWPPGFAEKRRCRCRTYQSGREAGSTQPRTTALQWTTLLGSFFGCARLSGPLREFRLVFWIRSLFGIL